MGQLLKVKIMNNKCFKPQNDKKVRELFPANGIIKLKSGEVICLKDF